MLKSHKNRTVERWPRLVAVLIVWLFAIDANAALVINSATVDGGATTTVAAGSTISLSITVTSSGGGASNDWFATGWLIANASGPLACVNHADYSASGTYTETFNITAPATAGTFNVYLVAYRSDTCTSAGSSPQFVLANAVITTPATIPVCETFRDEFSTAAYNNQNGSFNWATDWSEVGDDGTATGGNIQVASNSVRFRGGLQPATPLNGRYLARQADLSGFTSATLTFDYRESGIWEPNDEFDIYASADGGSNWTLIQTFTDDQGGSFQPFSADLTPYIASNTRIAFVIRADNAGESFFIDNVQIEACAAAVGLDHFTITPATTNASTCLPNAITIVAEDASNNPITNYTGTVNIGTSSGNGNWSVNDADNVTNPNPDVDDDGAVDYGFLASDAGEIILDLTDTRAETLTISVSDAFAGVTSTSVAISFADNVFIITEDPVQVAGRPQAMSIALWTNDGSNCFIDTSYNYNPQILEASIDRGGVLPGANDPAIGAVVIPQGPASAAITLDFSAMPGQASFTLDSSDVGQYRLNITDNSNVHSAGSIVGSSNILTVRPFGIAVTGIRAGAIVNPGGSAPADPIFTVAGGDFEATVSAVLWDAADDTDNDGVLDTGFFANNVVAPSFAWDTTLAASTAAASYTPDPGTPGVLNNGNILLAEFGGGSFNVTDLQYTEVGSFTLQSSALDFLGVASADIAGDDIVVGRFIPALFQVTHPGANNGQLGEGCVGFSYIGQDFSYAAGMEPVFTVTAQNALGATTAQYRDGFVKLGANSATVVATQDEVEVGTDALPMLVSYAQAAMLDTPNNDGSVDYRFGADTFRYGPASPVSFAKYDNSEIDEYTGDIDPEITAVSDGEVTTIYAAGTHKINPDGNLNRFGRLNMKNAFGSEISSLPMQVYVEYLDNGVYQKSMGDTCTAISAADLLNTPAAFSVPTVDNNPAAAGNVNYSYPAPGANGTVNTITRLDPAWADQLWLRYDWNGDGVFDDDPNATATFGIFEGNEVQIYIQQRYEGL
ncbi:MAG: choice-of-anchor J domain-containing protein [Gammaproteobacteria bacterium]|nr:choice-of-anchor J domain-containing protein [Gammaproteobacteria bacterium]